VTAQRLDLGRDARLLALVARSDSVQGVGQHPLGDAVACRAALAQTIREVDRLPIGPSTSVAVSSPAESTGVPSTAVGL